MMIASWKTGVALILLAALGVVYTHACLPEMTPAPNCADSVCETDSELPATNDHAGDDATPCCCHLGGCAHLTGVSPLAYDLLIPPFPSSRFVPVQEAPASAPATRLDRPPILA